MLASAMRRFEHVKPRATATMAYSATVWRPAIPAPRRPVPMGVRRPRSRRAPWRRGAQRVSAGVPIQGVLHRSMQTLMAILPSSAEAPTATMSAHSSTRAPWSSAAMMLITTAISRRSEIGGSGRMVTVMHRSTAAKSARMARLSAATIVMMATPRSTPARSNDAITSMTIVMVSSTKSHRRPLGATHARTLQERACRLRARYRATVVGSTAISKSPRAARVTLSRILRTAEAAAVLASRARLAMRQRVPLG